MSQPSNPRSSQDEPFQFADSSEEVVAPQAPYLTIFALLATPVAAICSVPIWKSYLSEKLYSSPTQPHAPDPGQLGGFALVALVFFTVVAASYVGLIFAALAQKKEERWKGLRIAAWVINGIFAGGGTFLFLKHFLKLS